MSDIVGYQYVKKHFSGEIAATVNVLHIITASKIVEKKMLKFEEFDSPIFVFLYNLQFKVLKNKCCHLFYF